MPHFGRTVSCGGLSNGLERPREIEFCQFYDQYIGVELQPDTTDTSSIEQMDECIERGNEIGGLVCVHPRQ